MGTGTSTTREVTYQDIVDKIFQNYPPKAR